MSDQQNDGREIGDEAHPAQSTLRDVRLSFRSHLIGELQRVDLVARLACCQGRLNEGQGSQGTGRFDKGEGGDCGDLESAPSALGTGGYLRTPILAGTGSFAREDRRLNQHR